MKHTMESEFNEYMTANIPTVLAVVKKELGIKSQVVVESDKGSQRYNMVGGMLGFAYLSYRKSKKAEHIQSLYYKFKMEDKIVKSFSSATRNHFQSIGCPLEAIVSQNLEIQKALLGLVVKFAADKGIEMRIKSFID